MVVETHKSRYWILVVAILLIALVLIIIFSNGLNGSVIRSQEEQIYSTEELANESLEIKMCQLEVKALSTGEYDELQKSAENCRLKINSVMGKVARLYIEEKDEALKREYSAILIDIREGAIALDLNQNNGEILSNTLSEKEVENKKTINKELIIEFLGLIENMESNYSDTNFFKNNYGSIYGKETLENIKKAYNETLKSYN
jgi:hypothetical protein